ncbi:LLM class flavin-dependent oxidoreductase [Alkalihalobacillus sp. FSL W8-0930]
MKLSILDQVVQSRGQSPQETIKETIQLAQFAEKWGYHRYWVAEHHDLPGLSCPAPDLILSLIGSKTDRIRIGSGAVLLPNYKPYTIAERYHLLATLYPGRVDLGMSRSPGGSAEASVALTGNMLEAIYQMPAKVEELLHFLSNDFHEDHMYSTLQAAPVPDVSPIPWILGTSKKSAELAGSLGLPYAVGHFMNKASSMDAVKTYRDHFQASKYLDEPEVILAVSVICAETNEQAEDLARSGHIWSIERTSGRGSVGLPSVDYAKQYPLDDGEKEMLTQSREQQIIGDTKTVREQLEAVADTFQTNECLVLTNVHSFHERMASYQRLASIFELT